MTEVMTPRCRKGMDTALFSTRYRARLLSPEDVPQVVALCRGNPLFYRYCPPFVTGERVLADMRALPPGKKAEDKYYTGFFDGDRLIAVLDLILGYPGEDTGFVGFFMTDASIQGRGIGSSIIGELCRALKEAGYREARLGWVKGNPQSAHFWHKNGFRETGASYETDGYTVVIARRDL